MFTDRVLPTDKTEPGQPGGLTGYEINTGKGMKPVIAVLEGDTTGSARVLPLSSDRILLAPLHSGELPRDSRIRLHLGFDERDLGPYMIQRVAEHGRPGNLEYRFEKLALESVVEILELLDDLHMLGLTAPTPSNAEIHEDIRSRRRIQQTLRYVIDEQRIGAIWQAGSITCRLTPVGMDDDGARVHWETQSGHPTTGDVVVIEGQASVFSIVLDSCEERPGGISTAFPEQISRLRRRRWRRTRVPGGYVIRFNHPLLPEIQIERDLLDISLQGLSFLSGPNRCLVHPGLVIPELQVIPDNGVPLDGAGVIRRVSHDAEADDIIFGMQVDFDDDLGWQDRVSRLLYPWTRNGATWSRKFWNLFEDSGYFTLSGKSSSHFTPLRESFATVSRRLDSSPRIGCQAVWPAKTEIDATVSLTKIYSGTWLGHQLMVDPNFRTNPA